MQVATLAYDRLNPAVRAKVDALIKPNPDYSKWVDGVADADRDREADGSASSLKPVDLVVDRVDIRLRIAGGLCRDDRILDVALGLARQGPVHGRVLDDRSAALQLDVCRAEHERGIWVVPGPVRRRRWSSTRAIPCESGK